MRSIAYAAAAALALGLAGAAMAQVMSPFLFFPTAASPTSHTACTTIANDGTAVVLATGSNLFVSGSPGC